MSVLTFSKPMRKKSKNEAENFNTSASFTANKYPRQLAKGSLERLHYTKAELCSLFFYNCPKEFQQWKLSSSRLSTRSWGFVNKENRHSSCCMHVDMRLTESTSSLIPLVLTGSSGYAICGPDEVCEAKTRALEQCVLDLSDPAVRQQLADETPEEELCRWTENKRVMFTSSTLKGVDVSVTFDGEVSKDSSEAT